MSLISFPTATCPPSLAAMCEELEVRFTGTMDGLGDVPAAWLFLDLQPGPACGATFCLEIDSDPEDLRMAAFAKREQFRAASHHSPLTNPAATWGDPHGGDSGFDYRHS